MTIYEHKPCCGPAQEAGKALSECNAVPSPACSLCCCLHSGTHHGRRGPPQSALPCLARAKVSCSGAAGARGRPSQTVSAFDTHLRPTCVCCPLYTLDLHVHALTLRHQHGSSVAASLHESESVSLH